MRSRKTRARSCACQIILADACVVDLQSQQAHDLLGDVLLRCRGRRHWRHCTTFIVLWTLLQAPRIDLSVGRTRTWSSRGGIHWIYQPPELMEEAGSWGGWRLVSPGDCMPPPYRRRAHAEAGVWVASPGCNACRSPLYRRRGVAEGGVRMVSSNCCTSPSYRR